MALFIEHIQSPVGILEIAANNETIEYLKIFQSQDNLQKPMPNMITNMAIQQLDEYFSHQRLVFDLPLKQATTPFKNKVYKILLPITEPISYKSLAKLAGNEKASRAVGSAMATNQIPIIIPCHRVLTSDMKVVNYYYGPEMKTWLLAHEEKTRLLQNEK